MKTKIIFSALFLFSALLTYSQESPYAMFGDNTKTLMTKHESDADYTLKIPLVKGDKSIGVFELNMQTGMVEIKDKNNSLLLTKQLTNEERARFMTMDPMAEKYYSISPYAYCANNPLRFTDPTGMDFTDRAWDEIGKFVKEYNKKYYNNSVEINKLKQNLKADGLSTKQIKKIEGKIGNLESANKEIDTIRGEIATLAASNQMYDIYTDNSLSTSGPLPGMGVEGAGANFNFSNGNFDIRLPSNGGFYTIAHELKHAYQFETGTNSTSYFQNGLPFYDQHDELEAYKRGELFGGPIHRTLNSLSDYQQFQVGPMDVTKLPQVILNNPSQLQKLANRTRSTFRYNNKTYIGIW